MRARALVCTLVVTSALAMSSVPGKENHAQPPPVVRSVAAPTVVGPTIITGHITPSEATRSRHLLDGRKHVAAPARPGGAFALWVRRAAPLRRCEGGSAGYRAVSPSGKYRGAYQMDRHFWLTYGGNPSETPDEAPPWEQDQVAYRGYLARGWEPWSCARILGWL